MGGGVGTGVGVGDGLGDGLGLGLGEGLGVGSGVGLGDGLGLGLGEGVTTSASVISIPSPDALGRAMANRNSAAMHPTANKKNTSIITGCVCFLGVFFILSSVSPEFWQCTKANARQHFLRSIHPESAKSRKRKWFAAAATPGGMRGGLCKPSIFIDG